MTDAEKYLFDVLGFIVCQDVISTDEVAELNRLVDQQSLAPPEAGENPAAFGDGGELLEWGKPFCELVDHPRVMEVLEWSLGAGPRIEQAAGISAVRGTRGHALHAASYTHYDFRNGRAYAGLTVVSWALTDGGGDCGGFCCIPGSHKVNYTFPVPVGEYPYPVPPEIEESYEEADFLMVPRVKAGSVVIFTEALTHGSVTWKASHERRALLYRYGGRTQQHSPVLFTPPEKAELSEFQRFLFEPPGPRSADQIPRRES